MFRRFGRPGLIGTVARTAVIAGTATMTDNAILRQQQQRALEQDDLSAEPGAPAVGATTGSSAAPPAGAPDLVDKLGNLARLHESGALTDAEFVAAKAQLLG